VAFGSGARQTLSNAVAAYDATPAGAPQWNALQTAATSAATALTGTIIPAIMPASSLPSQVTTSAPLATTYLTVLSNIDISDASTFTSSVNTAISALPPLAPYTAQIILVTTQYTALGSPASQIIAGPVAALDSIDAAAMDSGNSAKEQVSQTVLSFRGSATNMKDSIFGRVDYLRATYEPMTAQYDGYRYIVSLAFRDH
jgi:hypothetical protein